MEVKCLAAPEELQSILDNQELVPLKGEGVARGKVDYDLVLQEFVGKWTTFKDLWNFVKEDLGTDVTYSATHSWVQRLAKKANYDVLATEYDNQKYIKIVEAESEE